MKDLNHNRVNINTKIFVTGFEIFSWITVFDNNVQCYSKKSLVIKIKI